MLSCHSLTFLPSKHCDLIIYVCILLHMALLIVSSWLNFHCILGSLRKASILILSGQLASPQAKMVVLAASILSKSGKGEFHA
ncbi:hypothetical protein J1N35_024895 [Gossypium stocksii]|uniref:Uncharacterized protein n=1 Tax=Gossypium stocksii TaxID=47602 RepID=A0A9D3V579_9ROSI|nr:hypothetical protein J1N35_024895 [Gossypium stocksii]